MATYDFICDNLEKDYQGGNGWVFFYNVEKTSIDVMAETPTA